MSTSKSVGRLATRPWAASTSSSSSAASSSTRVAVAQRRNVSSSSVRSAPSTEVERSGVSSYEPVSSPASHLPRLARQDPELYAAVRPPPLATFAALTSRLGLLPAGTDAETRDRRVQLVYQACTHPSFQTLVDKVNASTLAATDNASASGLVRNRADNKAALDAKQFLGSSVLIQEVQHHAALCTVGNSLLGMLASEFLHLRYPNLPTRALKAAVAAFVGPQTLSDVGLSLGLGGQGVLRWNKEARVPKPKNYVTRSGKSAVGLPDRTLLSRDVGADAMRALVAVVFQELGLSAARRFVTSHLLNRKLDLAKLLKFLDPKRALSQTCAKYGKDLPQSRIIAESGRLSISPVFVVGVWSGATKIGEGSGTSIKMAEFRAAEDALRRLYLTETPLGDFDLPSTTLDTIYAGASSPLPTSTSSSSSASYNPQPIGDTEVLEAAGKSRH
ncbi:ribonuclease III [Testicularia cyperi]|uniref:Large ribosomal subunit protein mL44 n=1 Tax=Testicularia cyperi TaxID=1882483 RepID=A0A317Y0V3_9BASI|nr:ribonuclease III [Testicularia cyperi]